MTDSQEASDFPRSFTVSIEDVISNMLIDKSQKEYLYHAWVHNQTGMKKNEYDIIWKEGRIQGIKLHKAMEYIQIKLTIDKNGVKLHYDR